MEAVKRLRNAKGKVWLIVLVAVLIAASATYLAFGGKDGVAKLIARVVRGEPSETSDPAGHGGHEGQEEGDHNGHGGHSEGEVAHGEHSQAGEEAMQIHLTAEERERAGVRTAEMELRPLQKEIQTVGKIDYDEKRLAFVSARVAGRIDKLFVNFTGMIIRKGQPLLEIYSPDLVTTQQEYLLALTTLEKVQQSPRQEIIDGAKAMVEASKRRLLLWGITEEQIAELKERRQPLIHMTIYSPIAGTVIEKKAIEGKYVQIGDSLYTIADLSSVWMLADIYEYELSWVKLGQPVEVMTLSYPERPFKGRITFINPVMESETRTVKIRAEVPNPDGKLKPGMFVNAKVVAPTRPMLVVPASAILDAGIRKFAWVEQGHGRYERREVNVGPEVNGYYPVLAGLSKGEKVVTAANFLIDSQAQLAAGASAGGHGGHGEHGGHGGH